MCGFLSRCLCMISVLCLEIGLSEYPASSVESSKVLLCDSSAALNLEPTTLSAGFPPAPSYLDDINALGVFAWQWEGSQEERELDHEGERERITLEGQNLEKSTRNRLYQV